MRRAELFLQLNLRNVSPVGELGSMDDIFMSLYTCAEGDPALSMGTSLCSCHTPLWRLATG